MNCNKCSFENLEGRERCIACGSPLVDIHGIMAREKWAGKSVKAAGTGAAAAGAAGFGLGLVFGGPVGAWAGMWCGGIIGGIIGGAIGAAVNINH